MRRMLMVLLVITCVSLLITTVAFAQVGVWVKKADMPTARYAMGVAVVDGNIYVIGGWGNAFLKTVEMYDPRSDRWETKAGISQGSLGVGVATVNGKIYAIGGWDGNNFFNTVEEYDPVADNWTKKANMPTARNWPSTAVVDGIIYAIGGCDVSTFFTSVVEAYDPIADKWSRKANLPFSGVCRNAVVNGKIYVMGWIVFVGAELQTRPDMYEYDPKLDTWTKKADMPTIRYAISAIALNGKIYAVGGSLDVNPYTKVSTVEIYNPNTDTWENGINLSDERAYHVSSVVDGKIYIIGGVDTWPNPDGFPGPVLSTVEVFDTGFSVSPQGRLATMWGKVK